MTRTATPGDCPPPSLAPCSRSEARRPVVVYELVLFASLSLGLGLALMWTPGLTNWLSGSEEARDLQPDRLMNLHDVNLERSKRQVPNCGSWSNWVSHCAPCGGCGRRVRRCQDNSGVTDVEHCPAKICYRGRHSRREHAWSPKGRYIIRARRCCYDFRKSPPVLMPFPRRCTAEKCGGFVHPNPCETNPCQNSGVCVRLGSSASYRCDCSEGYTGINCETEVDRCLSNPCQNGGLCNSDRSLNICRCIGVYHGTFCENRSF